MDIVLLLLCSLFMSFIFSTIGIGIYLMVERRSKTYMQRVKELDKYDLLEENYPELFKAMEKYKGMRFIAIILAGALLLTYLFIYFTVGRRLL